VEVTLNGAGSSDPDGTVEEYEWFEGGNFIATGVAPMVTLGLGVHVITLQVTDDDGATTEDEVVITVTNAIPIAEAGPDQTVLVTLPAQFDGSASYDVDGNVTAFAWDFGDGNLAAGAIVSHPYSVAGVFTVTLTVTDNDGATDTDGATVTVRTPSEAVGGTWVEACLSPGSVGAWTPASKQSRSGDSHAARKGVRVASAEDSAPSRASHSPSGRFRPCESWGTEVTVRNALAVSRTGA
jgi:PKD repeat protein